VLASAQVSRIGWEWRKHEAVLTTTAGAPESSANHFVILASPPGTVWLNMVSLFPPTYANRPNGNRRDIIERLAAMHPAFLRFPGGNYLEGGTIETRFNWKKKRSAMSRAAPVI
jgi:alpha-N-arabinofuranosidase